MRKEDLKKVRGLLYGIGFCLSSFTLTGCGPVKSENVVIRLKNNNYKQEYVGFIKNNEEMIPYFKETTGIIEYYRYDTGEYIGKSEYDTKAYIGKLSRKVDEKSREIIVKENELLYVEEQIIPFQECNPNAYYNYEAISEFTEETYKNLEKSYFASHTFSTKDFRIYEIKNLTSNEISYVIGRKANETKIFNYETYMLEDYTGYAITEIGLDLEEDYELYYSRIVKIIEDFRKEHEEMKLERK